MQGLIWVGAVDDIFASDGGTFAGGNHSNVTDSPSFQFHLGRALLSHASSQSTSIFTHKLACMDHISSSSPVPHSSCSNVVPGHGAGRLLRPLQQQYAHLGSRLLAVLGRHLRLLRGLRSRRAAPNRMGRAAWEEGGAGAGDAGARRRGLRQRGARPRRVPHLPRAIRVPRGDASVQGVQALLPRRLHRAVDVPLPALPLLQGRALVTTYFEQICSIHMKSCYRYYILLYSLYYILWEYEGYSSRFH